MSKNNSIKISVKRGKCSAFIEVPENFLDTKVNTITNMLKQCLDSIDDNKVKTDSQPIKLFPSVFSEPKETVIQPARDEFKIRERIPNNIVDIKDLDIKQAVTEKALVRCPKCGQAHCLAVNSGNKIYVMERDFDKDDFHIIAEFDSLTSNGFVGMCCKPDTDKMAYFNDLQSLPIISFEDFAANNDTEVFCPVCCESDTFFNWKNAYEQPLAYFETEHLCDVCGGETVTKMIKKQKKNKCEVCGYETPYKEG